MKGIKLNIKHKFYFKIYLMKNNKYKFKNHFKY